MQTQTVDGAQPFPDRRIAYYALGVLILTAFCSFLDRQLLNLLAPPIKADLHITDTQLGLLQGFAFAMLFAVMAVPFGWMADRTNRRNLAIFGVLLWSASTVYSGFGDSFAELAIARAGVGLGEATLMPVAFSLLSDYFPPTQRGRAFALFTMGNFLGSSSALLIGGAVLRGLGDVHAVTLPLIGQVAVWKAAFILVGLPGFLVAPFLFSIPEPVRRTDHAAVTGQSQNSTLLGYIRSRPSAFFFVWAVYSVLALLSYSVTPWAPTLLVRQQHMPLATVGIAVGLSSLIGGLLGATFSGVLSDRWVAKGVPAGRFRLTIIWWIGAVPSLLLMTLAPSPALAVLGLFCFNFFNTQAYVAASAVIQDMAPAALRGRITAFWALVTGIIGNGFGPLATGLVTDHVLHNEALIHYSILIVGIPAAVVGLALSVAGLKPYEAARAAIQGTAAKARNG